MKALAILSVIVLIAAIGGVGYLYMTSSVVVAALDVFAVEADTQPELFAALKSQVESGSVIGTAYTGQTALGDASGYQFLTYTVRLKNNCFVTADMVELQVTPMEGDVLQIGDFQPKALQAQTTGDLQAVILTDIHMHATRELNVTYYIWGMPFTLRTICSQ